MSDVEFPRSRRPLQNVRMRSLEELSPGELQQLDAYRDFKGRHHCITLMIELLMAPEEEARADANQCNNGMIVSMTSPTKFSWPGRSATGSVILPLHMGLDQLPGTLPLAEITLIRKAETHLTLLSTGEAEHLATHLLETEWQNAFDSEQWKIGLLGAFDLLREERAHEAIRFSVIRHLHCPALNAFRRRLTEASGIDLAETLPHVTVYTAGHERGIGLTSLADYHARRVRRLSLAEWQSLVGMRLD